jgi:cobalamin biosynthesis protein CobD/CbiB
MTSAGSPPYPVDEPEVSLGELVARVSEDFGSLVQSHIELAKQEITTEIKEAARGAGLLGGSGLAGWIAILLISFALAWGLAELIGSTWLGFLLVGLIWAIVAGVLFFSGRQKLQEVHPVPRETIDELEEDKKWLSEQTN